MKESNVINLKITQQNDITQPLIDEINDACNKAEDLGHAGVLVIQLTGEPASEIKTVENHDSLAVYQVNRWERALRRIEKLNVVTVAVIEADIGGLAMALMLTTDYRISIPQGSMNLLNRHKKVMPGMSLHRLANLVGVAKARKLVLFGESLCFERAMSMDLIDCFSDQPNKKLFEFISGLCKDTIDDIAIRRRLLLECLSQSYEEALGAHLAASDRALRAQA